MRYDREKFRQVLKDRELTHLDLQRLTARKFPPRGVSLSTIRQFSSGQKNGEYTMWKIAKALNVPLSVLELKNSKRKA